MFEKIMVNIGQECLDIKPGKKEQILNLDDGDDKLWGLSPQGEWLEITLSYDLVLRCARVIIDDRVEGVYEDKIGLIKAADKSLGGFICNLDADKDRPEDLMEAKGRARVQFSSYCYAEEQPT